MRSWTVILVGFATAISAEQTPPPFPPNLGTTHKFPSDPKFVWKYSPAIAEALDHLSNRLWSIGVCSDDQFHPEMQLTTGEFAIWASGLVTAYKSLAYYSAPFSEYPKISKALGARLTASKKHVEEQLMRHDQEGFYKQSPTSTEEHEDYEFAYNSLFNDQAWMGTKKPFDAMTRNDLADWLANGFGDARFRDDLRKQPIKYRFEIISRGEALLRLYRVSRAIMPSVNVTAAWVDPLISPDNNKVRFVKRDKFPDGSVLTIASAMSNPFGTLEFVVQLQNGSKRTLIRTNQVADFKKEIERLQRRNKNVTLAGDYYCSDIGVRIRSPFPPILRKDFSGFVQINLDSETTIGWGMVPKVFRGSYKKLVSERASVPIESIQEDHSNSNYSYAWINGRANSWSVTSSRFWTFFGFATGPKPFQSLPAPLIEAWTYYGKP